jgi:hypothetical protein
MWGFVSKDVTKKQSDSTYIEGWTESASKKLVRKIEEPILGTFWADAHVKNQGATAGFRSSNVNLGVTGTPIALTKVNIIDKLVEMDQVMSEQNVPREGCWVVLPPWALARMRMSDIKDASMTGDGTSILRRRDGRVGMIGRFEIFESNMLSAVVDGANTVTRIPFGHKDGLTFATQLVKSEGPMRSDRFFGDLFRGLQVYGHKVIKPEAVGLLYAYAA